MTATIQDVSALLQRVQTLEAKLTSMKRSVTTRTVRAQSFILAARDGTTRGWIAVSESGTPELKLAAEDGSVRAEFLLDDSEAPRLVMFDEEGRQRAALQVSETGEPSAYLWDNTGANMIALRAAAEGECEVILNGGVKGRLRLATNAEGTARLELLGEDSQARVVIRSGEARPAEVLLLDAKGEPRAELFLETNDATALQLHDYLQNKRMMVGIDDIGKPAVVLFDEEESEEAALRPRSVENDDLDSDDESGALSIVSTAFTVAKRQSLSPAGQLPDDSAVTSLIYPTELLDAWRLAMNHTRNKMTVYDHAFTYDKNVAIALVGTAREFSWSSTNLVGAHTDHHGVAVFAVIVNRSSEDIKSFDVSKLVLVDDKGHQYSSDGSFYWAEGGPSFNRYSHDIIGGARQEGFLLFPSLRRGSTRYVDAVLRVSFWVDEAFGERKYGITLTE